ncbi:GNAT family N-acetyltransferase [Pantoea sp. 18069]|uniref:GNAT family N-acetyltransferase n=1 Tax=Pantoea sp. 18069 TaxID=2681415 RepID=UPI0027D27D58|nr:GNAT family protein [Pantoea sp. 18069]
MQAEVGYIFHPDFACKGYATEAVGAMLGLGFEALDCHRIFARLDALNAGSVGVVERLRMRREAHLIQNDRFEGVWGDEYIYAMLMRLAFRTCLRSLGAATAQSHCQSAARGSPSVAPAGFPATHDRPG